MTDHKYQVGQLVRFAQEGAGRSSPAGDFRIERLLPEGDRQPQYRVKSILDGRERIVRETEVSSRVAV